MSIFIGDNKVAGVGNPGRTGKPGESAYEIAKKYGYEGTEEEFALELSNAATKPDWLEEDENSPAFIKNKPPVAQADWLEEDENSPAYIRNKPEKFNSVIDWNQNDPDGEGYVKNRTHYDGRYTAKTENVTINDTSGTFGYVKVANSIDFDIEKVKTMTLFSNTGFELEDISVLVVYKYQGYNLITSDGQQLVAVYLKTENDADVWFNGESHSGPGLYIQSAAEVGEDVSFYYSFTYETGEIVQIDPVYIKDMYYDISYIENTIPESTVIISDGNGCEFIGLYDPFIEGETYTVICNGVEYSCIAWKSSKLLDSVYLGNGDIYGGGPSNGEPFCLNYFYDNVYLFVETDGTYTISVRRNARDLKQIDQKYISIDWNQNEVDKSGYIKNRTHWTEEVWQEQTLVDNVTLNYKNSTFNNQVTAPFELDLIMGKIYTVIWDGVEYKCEASRIESSLDGEGLRLDNETFKIVVYLNGSDIPVVDKKNTGENHTISIIGPVRVEMVHKIDPKYLPDDIGGIKNQKTNDMTQLVGIGEDDLAYASKIFDGIILKDAGNGYEYVCEMYNGIFTAYCRCDHIEISQMPTKTEYNLGDEFDPSGMIVSCISQDGVSRVIENYTYPNVIKDRVTNIEIQYIESGITYISQIPISVI